MAARAAIRLLGLLHLGLLGLGRGRLSRGRLSIELRGDVGSLFCLQSAFAAFSAFSAFPARSGFSAFSGRSSPSASSTVTELWSLVMRTRVNSSSSFESRFVP